jgi:hypothetical protein
VQALLDVVAGVGNRQPRGLVEVRGDRAVAVAVDS